MKKLIIFIGVFIVSFTQKHEFISGDYNRSDVSIRGYSHIEPNIYTDRGIPANLETILNYYKNNSIKFLEYKKEYYPYTFNIKDDIYCLTYEPISIESIPERMDRKLFFYKKNETGWKKEIKEPLKTDFYINTTDSFGHSTIMWGLYNNASKVIGVEKNVEFEYNVYLSLTQFNYDLKTYINDDLKSIKQKQHCVLYTFIETPEGFKYYEKKFDNFRYRFDDNNHFTIKANNVLEFSLISENDTTKYIYTVNPKTYEISSETIH
ncbi:MAG: hypothetical protein ACOC33_00955 [bacterium]